MNPLLKYTLARVGLFAACAVAFLVLLPAALNPMLKLLLALAVSSIGSLLLLRRARDQMANHLAVGSRRRAREKERLRAALAGEDEQAEADAP